MRLIFVLVLVLGVSFCFANYGVAQRGGAAVFEELKCSACHKPDKKTAGVSVAEISKAYQSKDKLVTYFKGASQPIIPSDKAKMMQAPLQKISALPDKEKEALAEYIMSVK